MQGIRSVGFFIAAAALIGSLCAGCGPTEGQKAQTAAREFVSSMQEGDRAGVARTLTMAARERMGDSPDAFAKKSDGATGYSLGETTVDGEKAHVRVTMSDGEKSQPTKILLRRENQAWKVYAMSGPSPTGGPDITMDFEHPEAVIGEAFRELGRAAGLFASGMAKAAEGFAKGFEEGTAHANERAKKNGETPPFPIIETPPKPAGQ